MGTYGILRINYGILPAATLAPAWAGHSLSFWLLAYAPAYGLLCAPTGAIGLLASILGTASGRERLGTAATRQEVRL